ncbi:MAG: site-specific integrase [Acidimicrobiia bacterium]|nr:site-specific integrase [Acidimicrobiia bacterium]
MKRRAQGEGSLYFDSEKGRWVGQADAGLNPKTGKRRRLKVIGGSGETKTEVATRLRNKISDLENLSASAPKTVADLVSLWLSKGAPKNMDRRTLTMVESMVRNHLITSLGSVRVGALMVEDVEAWLDAKAETMAKSSVIKLRSYLAQAFDFGIRRRHAVWNPARIAELPVGATDRRSPRALTAPEAKALLNVARHHRLGALVTAGVTLGLRPAELTGLEWAAIDFAQKTITVYQSLQPKATRDSKSTPTLKGTKTGLTRTLQLPAPTVAALERHRAAQVEERLLVGDRWPLKWRDVVFVTSNGTPIDASAVRKLVSRLAAEAGLQGVVTPYDLRHTATSLLSAAGESAEKLADLLGHKDTRMVFKHYRHPVTSTISTAVEYWDRATG